MPWTVTGNSKHLFPPSLPGAELAINNNLANHTLLTDPGQVRSLWCVVRNNTRGEELLWLRGDRTVDLKEGNKVNASNICISPVTEDDNGVTFTCKLAQDPATHISVILNVTFSPLLTGEDPDPVEENSDVTLSCHVKANPHAQMAWYKDNSILALEKDHHQVYQSSVNFQLTIKGTQKSDNGTYTCWYLAFLPTDKKPVFPLEAIIAAAVVVVLTLTFGIVARREKIFKVRNTPAN
uniref:Ig-like domain-containing protein n=1 Tax=Sphenodon punctatus TaxID=8508 RepID=A0A8D0GIP8_SPHPU